MQLGLNSILVTGEINIADGLSTDEIERLLSRIAARMRQVVPEVQNIYLEPHPVPGPSRAEATELRLWNQSARPGRGSLSN